MLGRSWDYESVQSERGVKKETLAGELRALKEVGPERQEVWVKRTEVESKRQDIPGIVTEQRGWSRYIWLLGVELVLGKGHTWVSKVKLAHVAKRFVSLQGNLEYRGSRLGGRITGSLWWSWV